MRHAPEELDKVLNQTGQGIKHEAHEVEEHMKEIGTAALHALSPQSSRSKRDQGQAQDEDDEGWMSDQSAGETPGNGAAATGGKSRGKSSKLKIPKFSVARPSGSRNKRTATRRGILGERPQTIHRSQSEDLGARRASINLNDNDDSGPSGTQTPSEETRGRTSAMRSPRPSAPGTGSGTQTPTYGVRPTHRRIDSIRSGAPSREMSPTRSVRFVEDGKGVSSPRVLSPSSPASPAFHTVPGTPLQRTSSEGESQSQTENEGQLEDESPKSQVRFSLPTSGDAGSHVYQAGKP